MRLRYFSRYYKGYCTTDLITFGWDNVINKTYFIDKNHTLFYCDTLGQAATIEITHKLCQDGYAECRYEFYYLTA